MSLIERAIGKLHAEHPNSRPGNGSDAAPALERAATALQEPAPEQPPPEPALPVDDGAREPATAPIEIPLQRLARQGFIVPGAEPGRTLNEFRMIKRPLVFNVSDRKKPALSNARRIMVTSALPGEGKTFCAINLALSIADERDHAVILVDADVARPAVPRTLGFSPRPGLMDALVDPAIDVAKLVAPTSIGKLSILTAGRHHAKATELLASAAMGTLLLRLSEQCPDCIIIFDSPPLLATTEASVLAVNMGQIVVVVEAARTPRGAVAAALASLDGVTGEISTLMNKAPTRSKSEFLPYGGYGYGYESRT